MSDSRPREIRQIPLERIDVLNPRERNAKAFADIVSNIKAIGLKKPIVVTPRPSDDGSDRYLLVCGEGRMKAFKTLGQATIPALVVEVDDEDAFIMSLTENVARRQWRPLELLAGIEQLLARIGLTIRSTTAIVLAIAGNAMKAFPGLGTLGGGVVHAFAYGLAFDSLGRALNLSLAEHARLDQLETERHLRDLLSEPGRERIERVARLVIDSLRKQPEAD